MVVFAGAPGTRPREEAMTALVATYSAHTCFHPPGESRIRRRAHINSGDRPVAAVGALARGGALRLAHNQHVSELLLAPFAR